MLSNQSSLYERHAAEAVKKMQKWVLLVSVIGFGLYALVLAPIYTQLSSNIAYQEAFVTYLVYYLLSASEIAVFLVVFPATVFALWRGGLLGSRGVWITFSAATLGKYLLNFLMDCIADGNVPSWSYFVDRDLPIILPNFLMELGQYVMIVLVSAWIIKAKKRKWQVDVLLDEKTAGNERSLAFPITRILSFKNPVEASSFFTGALLFVARLFSHLMYQLTQLVYTGEWEGWAVLSLDFVSDLLLGVITYLVMVFLLSSFDRKEMQELSELSQKNE